MSSRASDSGASCCTASILCLIAVSQSYTGRGTAGAGASHHLQLIAQPNLSLRTVSQWTRRIPRHRLPFNHRCMASRASASPNPLWPASTIACTRTLSRRAPAPRGHEQPLSRSPAGESNGTRATNRTSLDRITKVFTSSDRGPPWNQLCCCSAGIYVCKSQLPADRSTVELPLIDRSRGFEADTARGASIRWSVAGRREPDIANDRPGPPSRVGYRRSQGVLQRPASRTPHAESGCST